MIHHVWRGNFWRYNDILKNNSIKSVQEFIGLMQPVGALSEREKQTVDAESKSSVQFSSVTRSCPTLLRSHEPQHSRPPCPSPTPGVHPNPRPLSQWCHPTISSSVIPFSFCPQFFPASGSFQMNQLFASGGQSIGVSASKSVLPMNTQDWGYKKHLEPNISNKYIGTLKNKRYSQI